MVFHTERVSNIDFVSFVGLESLDFAHTGELSEFIVGFGFVEREIFLLEFFRYVPKLVKQGLHIYNLFLLDVGALKNLIGRAEVCLGLRHGARGLASCPLSLASLSLLFRILA